MISRNQMAFRMSDLDATPSRLFVLLVLALLRLPALSLS